MGLYSVIFDLFSRLVVGGVISNRMKQDLALRALNMAIAIRRPPPASLHHSDRRAQYCAHDDQELVRNHGFKVSISGKGNCYDNSAVESFFNSLKVERVWRRNWQNRRDVEVALFLSHGCRQTIAGQPNTSTASKTRAANTQHLAGNHPWPSNKEPHKMTT